MMPEDAADYRPDQPLQADLPETHLEQNYGNAEQHAGARCRPALQSERLQFVAGQGCNKDK